MYAMDSIQKKTIKKRRRTVITPDEIERLEDSFRAEPKPDRNLKLDLARELSKTENFINIWFQNRRAKERKLIKNPQEEEDFVPNPITTVSTRITKINVLFTTKGTAYDLGNNGGNGMWLAFSLLIMI